MASSVGSVRSIILIVAVQILPFLSAYVVAQDRVCSVVWKHKAVLFNGFLLRQFFVSCLLGLGNAFLLEISLVGKAV